MDVVLQQIGSLSDRLTSNPWKFNPRYKKECKTLLQRAAHLCTNHTWIHKFSQADSGVWWKSGLCNGFLIVLVRTHSLLQDCRYSYEPTFEYSARDFWSLCLELFWYEKLVQSSDGQPSEIKRLDTICLNDDMYAFAYDVRNRTRDSCEIKGSDHFTFNNYIRKGNHDTVGEVREVVLKGLEGRTFASKNITLARLYEVDIHLEVNHPNVVRFKGWCQTCGSAPFMVMELMDRDLRKWIQEQHPRNGKTGSRFQRESSFHLDYMVVAIDILHQIAQAMRYAHTCNVAHRDLKAENILVKEELYEGRRVSYFLTAKLADFGDSKQTEDGFCTTAKIGTRHYRAPEVMTAQKSNRKYSLQADVWSFGVLAWEVVTGQLPSEKDGEAQKWPKQGGWIHPYLVGCIQSCWELKPGKRPTFESICILMQHLKGSMFRNKAIYHVTAFILADKSHSELAKEYQMYQKDLDKWWINVLIRDLRPSKSPFRFNPQGCDPHKVSQLLDSLCKGRWRPNSFIICKCFQPDLSMSSRSMCSMSCRSSSSISNCSVDGYESFFQISWTDDDPVAQELCSQAALTNVEFMAYSFVEDTVDMGGSELSHSIQIFFWALADRLHWRHYCCHTCPSNNRTM